MIILFVPSQWDLSLPFKESRFEGVSARYYAEPGFEETSDWSVFLDELSDKGCSVLLLPYPPGRNLSFARNYGYAIIADSQAPNRPNFDYDIIMSEREILPVYYKADRVETLLTSTRRLHYIERYGSGDRFLLG